METLGIRLNNPLCLRYVKTNRWLGACGQENGFVKFESFYYGVRAAVFVLLKYIFTYKLITVRDIIERFAPSNDGNNVDLYVSNVERFMSEEISSDSCFEEKFVSLVFAMALVECSPRSYKYLMNNHFHKYVFYALDEYMIKVLQPVYGSNNWNAIYEIVKSKVE